jgi:hypothetical protein
MYDLLDASLRPRCYDAMIQFGYPMYMPEFDFHLFYFVLITVDGCSEFVK